MLHAIQLSNTGNTSATRCVFPYVPTINKHVQRTSSAHVALISCPTTHPALNLTQPTWRSGKPLPKLHHAFIMHAAERLPCCVPLVHCMRVGSRPRICACACNMLACSQQVERAWVLESSGQQLLRSVHAVGARPAEWAPRGGYHLLKPQVMQCFHE